jgi:hypothetical protein
LTAVTAESARWEISQPPALAVTSPPGQTASRRSASCAGLPSIPVKGASDSTTSTPRAMGSDQEVTSYGGRISPPSAATISG